MKQEDIKRMNQQKNICDLCRSIVGPHGCHDLQSAHDENASLKDRVRELERSCDRKDTRWSELTQEMNSYRTNNTKLQTENAALKERVRELEAQLKEKSIAAFDWENAEQECQVENQQLQTENADYKKVNSEYLEAIHRLRSENAELKRERDAALDENRAMQERLNRVVDGSKRIEKERDEARGGFRDKSVYQRYCDEAKERDEARGKPINPCCESLAITDAVLNGVTTRLASLEKRHGALMRYHCSRCGYGEVGKNCRYGPIEKCPKERDAE